MDKKDLFVLIGFSFLFALLVFTVVFGILYVLTFNNFVLTTELGNYSELNLPEAVHLKYIILTLEIVFPTALLIGIIVYITIFLILIIYYYSYW